MRKIVVLAALAFFVFVPLGASASFTYRTLDGSWNNVFHRDWGRSNTQYLRVAAARYADGIGQPVQGPPTRYVSNRIFNDVNQNLFSENQVTHWGFIWGQFMDHTFGLRQEEGGEDAPIGFDQQDPLEGFHNDLGFIPFTRTPAAPGTGRNGRPRQQVNTVTSYIDAWSVYGGTNARLEWMREGPVDGNLSNNLASLLMPDGYLPRRDARGDASTAPVMKLFGQMAGAPGRAMVAGDVRANENIGLTAVHTLFAREHNRIVAALPARLPEALKFQIARRVVGAEQEYVTYEEFLPAMGVTLSPYHGYRPWVNPGLTNEFATVGYRAHSMIHGELEPRAPEGTWTDEELQAFEDEGIVIDHEDGDVVLHVPLNIAFGNPDLVAAAHVGPILEGAAAESEYKNDEQIDDSLRSTLFQMPGAEGVLDLGAIDVERGRDHGMPSYNGLRRAYGLPSKTSFTAITGEDTDQFPDDPLIDQDDPIDDPNILDFTHLYDIDGNELPLGTEEGAVVGIRRSTLAARLRAIYGTVGRLDAFVGMVSEQHVQGTEFGELQLAIWKKQFENLRDGDRFFYENDPLLGVYRHVYGIDYRHTLAEIIEANTDAQVQPDVFKVPED